MFYEEKLTSEQIYDGIIIRVTRDTARLSGGKIVPREVAHHPGGVGIVAVTDEGKISAVRQYRYAVGEELLEIPAGKLEPGEDPLKCAKRELAEETGFSAKAWRALGKFYSSPGFLSETLHLYLATELTRGAAHPDEDEFLSVEEVSFADFGEMIQSGAVPDGKTIAAVFMAERIIN
ncbi:MAG: NUDIX hydrolase [Oscillospiraceae bacterium]|jgi:ADP-ribose pyrophosphatase|nr:NUDIX hydrolase [Oscillospiraceae bacterium]